MGAKRRTDHRRFYGEFRGCRTGVSRNGHSLVRRLALLEFQGAFERLRACLTKATTRRGHSAIAVMRHSSSSCEKGQSPAIATERAVTER